MTQRERFIQQLQEAYATNEVEKMRHIKEIWRIEAANESIKSKIQSYGKTISTMGETLPSNA